MGLETEIFNIKTDKQFTEVALKIFGFQIANCAIYKRYVENLKIDFKQINSIEEIPFLPIELFKSNKIVSGKFNPEVTFASSGTTGIDKSKHYVKSLQLYETTFTKIFELFYGPISNYCILALLPSYLEQGNSSLVYMVDKLIKKSKNIHSGFYMYNHEELNNKLRYLEEIKQKTILIGVSYALLDFAEMFKQKLNSTIIIETGGMKGRRKEMIREELHHRLAKKFKLSNIHSEYGMTELLSQAYSISNENFSLPPWMKIRIRDSYDPFKYVVKGKTGGINVIDLANIHTCSFIETKDIGRENSDSTLKILGRFDNADIRGCNLLSV